MPDFFASKADFDRAIEERIKPLLEELASIKSNRDTILAEKRKLEGKTTGVTLDGIIRTADALHVPRDLARQPADYQRWRKLAVDEGLNLQIIDQRPEKAEDKMPMIYTNDRKHYVHQSVVRGDATKYREEKSFAERKGLTMHIFASPTELPTEAFLEAKDD